MSLINDVLRDLDRRQASDGERTAVPNEVRPLPEPTSGARVNRGLLVALALTVGLYAAWLTRPWQEPAPRASNVELPSVVVPPNAVPPAPTLRDSAAAEEAEPFAAGLGPTRSDMVSEVSGGLKLSVALSLPAPPAIPASAPDGGVTTQPATNKVPMPPSAVASPPTSPSAASQAPLPPVARAAESSQPKLATATEKAVAAIPAVDDWTKAQVLLRSANPAEAEPLLRRVIELQPEAVAPRQALIGLLLSSRRFAEAVPVLKAGLVRHPAQSAWAMNLARLYAETSDYVSAWETLSAGLPHAQQQPDYLAFAGTVLQRLDRPVDAAAQYQAALRLRPDESRWWVGLGLALEAAAQPDEARSAYLRARAIGGYSAEMARFIDQKLQ